MLDLRFNAALQGLVIDHFVQCQMWDEELKVGVNANMAELLARVGSQCAIKDLVLEVLTIEGDPLGEELSLRAFAEQLDGPHLRNISSITFCIRGRFRLVEHWPNNLKEILQAEFFRHTPPRTLHFDFSGFR